MIKEKLHELERKLFSEYDKIESEEEQFIHYMRLECLSKILYPNLYKNDKK